MARPIKAPATEPGSLGLTPGTQMTVERNFSTKLSSDLQKPSTQGFGADWSAARWRYPELQSGQGRASPVGGWLDVRVSGFCVQQVPGHFMSAVSY